MPPGALWGYEVIRNLDQATDIRFLVPLFRNASGCGNSVRCDLRLDAIPVLKWRKGSRSIDL